MTDTNSNIEVDVEDLKNDSFMNHLNSTLQVKRDYELHEYDYEWLEIIEDVLPYLDNILRNPKRFIVNEEEIVKVELSKKITVESVIHLTQHTNLIQDYNAKTGDVKPSKVLNINKEESLDTYENRFIFTLINNLRVFLDQRIESTGENSFYKDSRNLKYEGNSKVGTDEIKFTLTIDALDKNIKPPEAGVSDLSYADRLKKIKQQLDGFMGSELMTTLAKLHVEKVRSPIRKTNVILKNPNFRKAEELWNYIQTYVNKDKNEVDKKNYFDDGTLKNEYDQAILMTYIANKGISSNGELSEIAMLSNVIDRLISNLLDSDDTLTEDNLKEIFIKEIRKVKLNNNNKRKVILRVFKDRMSKDNDKLMDDFSLLERI